MDILYQPKTRITLVLLALFAQLIATACEQAIGSEIDFASYATPEEKAQALAVQFPGLAVSIAHGEEILWDWAGGFADVEKQIPATTDTLFNIYSVSKMISGIAFARLHNEGVLTIDRTIRSIDPMLPEHYDSITIEHLLNHRSGVRHYKRGSDWKNFADHRCATTNDAVSYFSDDPLKFEPGTDELYSTFGMVLASHVLVHAVQESNFAGAINTQLDTDHPFRLDGADTVKATPYQKKGQRFDRVDEINAKCKFAGGGFVASSNQLALTGVKFARGEIVPRQELKAMLIDQKPIGAGFRYAMSTGEAVQLGGAYAVMRGGATGGRGLLLVLLDAQIAIAIAGNAEGNGDDVSALAISLAEHFLSNATE